MEVNDLSFDYVIGGRDMFQDGTTSQVERILPKDLF